MKISCLTIATGQGVKIYPVEPEKSGSIASIKEEDVLFNGDPYTHYIGRDKDGCEILRVNILVPVVIDYDYE